jgi:hypothetical protein
MMSQPRMETSPGPQQPTHNPMDPQPFYIASPDPPISTPTRRTWGQPQPITFAHQLPQTMEGGWRRGQWGSPMPPQQQQRLILNTFVQYFKRGGSAYALSHKLVMLQSVCKSLSFLVNCSILIKGTNISWIPYDFFFNLIIPKTRHCCSGN